MTTEWNGQGLPPAAQARMERGERVARPRASSGSPGRRHSRRVVSRSSARSWAASSNTSVSRAMEAAVTTRPAASPSAEAPPGPPAATAATATALACERAPAGGLAGFAPYVDALYHGYDTAVLRMLLECRDLHGDGVVGVRLEQRRLGQDNREFIAYGTAVRAHGKTRPANLFSTMLPAHDVAKLLHGGWAPAAITIGISLAIRHDDWTTIQQARTWGGNTEVSGYTELVNHVRSDARQQFARRTAAYGADGAIMSGMNLDIWEIEPGEGHRDHVALSFVEGTAIARFHQGAVAPTSSLKILSLSDRHVVPGRKP